MEDWRINELANEAMDGIDAEDGESYAFYRSAIEHAIKKALEEDERSRPTPITDIHTGAECHEHGAACNEAGDDERRALVEELAAAKREIAAWEETAKEYDKIEARADATERRAAELEAELDRSNSAINYAHFLVDDASYTDDGQAMYVDPMRVQELRDALAAIAAPAIPATCEICPGISDPKTGSRIERCQCWRSKLAPVSREATPIKDADACPACGRWISCGEKHQCRT